MRKSRSKPPCNMPYLPVAPAWLFRCWTARWAIPLAARSRTFLSLSSVYTWLASSRIASESLGFLCCM